MFDYRKAGSDVVIPGSFGRYSISDTDVVIDNFLNKQVEPVWENNKVGYNLNLPNPKGFISAACLKALAFKGWHLPLEYVHLCRILFADKDSTNIDPKNLIWKFPDKGIEVPTFPGFYFIPSFTKYAINKDGLVISLFGGECKIVSNSGHTGYRDIGIRRDDGKYVGTNIHRLLALTFIPYDETVNTSVVNHKDGDRDNNDLTNLEWVSCRDNVVHGHGLANGLTGPALGVINMLKQRNISLRADEISFSGVEVKDIVTGHIEYFSSQGKAAAWMGVVPATVSLKLNQRAVYPVIVDRFIVRRPNQEWPVWNEDKEYVQAKNKATLVKVVATGEILQFKSAKSAYTSLGLSKKVVMTSLKRRDRREIDGYVFKYDMDDKPF